MNFRAIASRYTQHIVRVTTLSLVATLAGVLPGAAQNTGTVTGTVTESESGAPIAGVTIRVVGGLQVATTRVDGGYRLQLVPGSYQLQAGMFGFAALTHPVTVSAGQSTTRDFSLAHSAVALDEIVAVGTRRVNRTVTESPVPVDVLPAAVIQTSGLIETSQILQRLAPSVNFPRTAIADGSDHLRPVTLRGLAPDQVLVLRERQAPPQHGAGARERHGGPRLHVRRPERDPGERDRPHRGAARRCRRAVRLGRDRRRGQHHSQIRRAARGDDHVRPRAERRERARLHGWRVHQRKCHVRRAVPSGRAPHVERRVSATANARIARTPMRGNSISRAIRATTTRRSSRAGRATATRATWAVS